MVKKGFASTVLLCSMLLLIAQERNCRPDFSRHIITNAADEKVLAAFLKKKLYNLQNEHNDLVLFAKNESPGGFHYTFVQQFAGLPIYNTFTRINCNKQNMVLSVFDNTVSTNGWSSSIVHWDFDFASQPFFMQYIQEKFKDATIKTATKIIYAEGEMPQLVYEVNLRNQRGRNETLLLSANEILQVRDANTYFAAPDSTVSGMVFNPDPLTTAGVPYGGNFVDNADADSQALNDQRQQKKFKAHFSGDTFRLKNQFIEIADLDNDGSKPVHSATPVFNYTRSQQGFEDVNAYYHLSYMRNWINGLGFMVANNFVQVDAHAGNQDNSFFSYPNELYFGEGGVDDAEDADVLVHEYSHFLSYLASPNSNVGTERNAADEGTCDYFAASYSKMLNAYNWGQVYNWDGHNEYWKGRSVIDAVTYPQNNVGSIYKRAAIWSAALMDIYNEIGRPATDSLVLQTMYGFAANQTLPMVAQALVDADTALTNGRYFCSVFRSFYKRGLMSFRANSCGVFPQSIAQITNENIRFASTLQSFKIIGLEEAMPMRVLLLDNCGRVIAIWNNETNIAPVNVADGTYFVRVETNAGAQTFQWIHFN